jgi:hypothetical protein
MLDNGAIGFIDFDGFCQAEPALDLALFRATVKDVGRRALRNDHAGSPGSERDGLGRQLRHLDHLCDSFLETYRTLHSVSRPRVALWEALDMLTAVLHCWTKVKFDRVEHRLEMLETQLRTVDLDL